MRMDAGLDTGPVIAEARTPIRDDDTGQSLHDRLASMGADLLVRTIPDYVAGKIEPLPQPAEGATYARKIAKEDGRIDWSRPAREIFNQIRGFNPWPGAFATIELGGRKRLLKIWRVRQHPEFGGKPGTLSQTQEGGLVIGCGDGGLALEELQLEGKRRMNTREFLAGHSAASLSVVG
jgi:methionyl-tRNA formyltransferase